MMLADLAQNVRKWSARQRQFLCRFTDAGPSRALMTPRGPASANLQGRKPRADRWAFQDEPRYGDFRDDDATASIVSLQRARFGCGLFLRTLG